MSLLSEIRAATSIPQQHPLMQSILASMPQDEQEEMESIRGMVEVSDWDLTKFLQSRGHKISQHTVWRWRRGHK